MKREALKGRDRPHAVAPLQGYDFDVAWEPRALPWAFDLWPFRPKNAGHVSDGRAATSVSAPCSVVVEAGRTSLADPDEAATDVARLYESSAEASAGC